MAQVFLCVSEGDRFSLERTSKLTGVPERIYFYISNLSLDYTSVLKSQMMLVIHMYNTPEETILLSGQSLGKSNVELEYLPGIEINFDYYFGELRIIIEESYEEYYEFILPTRILVDSIELFGSC